VAVGALFRAGERVSHRWALQRVYQQLCYLHCQVLELKNLRRTRWGPLPRVRTGVGGGCAPPARGLPPRYAECARRDLAIVDDLTST
jgi:hypothetical protein